MSPWSPFRLVVLGVGAVVGLGTCSSVASAAPAPEPLPAHTLLVNRSMLGEPALSDAIQPDISRDGRLVVLTNIGDDHHANVYLRNLQNGTTQLVSADASGQPTGGDGPHISADGAFVSYLLGYQKPVRVKDLTTGAVQTASVDTQGLTVKTCVSADISADGRYVVMACQTSLDPAVDEQNGIWLRDLVAGTTTNVTPPIDPSKPDVGASNPSISDDGSEVEYEAKAGGGNRSDVFVRDISSSTTRMASVTSKGARAYGMNAQGSISGDGGTVTFTSDAANLGPQVPTRYHLEVYVHDLTSGQTSRISGGPCTGGCPPDQLKYVGGSQPRISADGRYVSFDSQRQYVAEYPSGGLIAMYVVDRKTDTLRDVSVTGPDDTQVKGLTGSALSPSGRDAIFVTNPHGDYRTSRVFLRRRWANSPL